MKWRSVGAIPLPPKKTVEEHARTQAEYLESQLEPALAEARAGKRQVFFVDAAHFVMGAFLGCVWSAVRRMIRGGSGRKRYNVLGAWNAVTRELVTVVNDSYINALSVCELLRKIAALSPGVSITLVLDNARYQRCAVAQALAQSLGIELLFLPSYSPNLNLIERLWKFVKKKALNGRHYATFEQFQAAIDGCLGKVATEHRNALKTLMTHQFQMFDKASFLAA